MAFSGGVYSLVAGNPVTTNTTISSTTHNNTMSDIATNGLSLCVLKDGSQTITANIPMSSFKFTGLAAGSAAGNSLRYEQLFTTSAVTLLGAMDWVKGADIASGSTVNLTTATGNAVHVTGTTTITAVTLGSGMFRIVIFDGALTLTHHATNNNLPGGVNITTVANDRALYWSDGTTVWCIDYQQATVTGTGSAVLATSPTLTTAVLGSSTATTQSAGDNSTKVATTAYADRVGTTLATEQASTSGTAITFTGIPTTARRITMSFVGVSTNGTSNYLVQLGDAGGIETTGYKSSCYTGSTTDSTAGFLIKVGPTAAVTYDGQIILYMENSTNWTWTGFSSLAGAGEALNVGAGSKATSQATDRISLTTVNGTDAFDAGVVNISYSL